MYRGLEWLVVAEGRSWNDLANDLGVQVSHLRDFKKLTNVDTGVRHANAVGRKLRSSPEGDSTWVCALLDAINATRARLESDFTRMTPEQVSNVVLRAGSMLPYD